MADPVTIIAAVEGIKKAKEIVETSHSTATFPDTLNKLVSGPGPNPILGSLELLHGALANLQDFALAAWTTAREESLAHLRAESTAALLLVNEFLQAGSPFDDPLFIEKLGHADALSLVPATLFSSDLDGSFWLRPNSLAAISWAGDPNDWMVHLADRAPVDASGRVWDHRWALPAAVYAITARIAVLRVAVPDRTTRILELRRYNTFIAKAFQARERGVRVLKEMSPQQLDQVPTHQIPIAVADIHGGFFVGGRFGPFFNPGSSSILPFPPPIPELPFPEELFMPGATIEANVSNHRLITNYARNYVSIRIGQPDLLMFAGVLENLLAAEEG